LVLIKSEDIEQEFIELELDEHYAYLADLFIDDINNKKLIKSEKLLNHFENENVSEINKGSYGTTLKIKFPNYGRFIEIQSKKKIKSNNIDTNALLWGVKEAKSKKKKNTDWYTKNVYGAQGRLIGRIMYGFSDIVRQQILKSLTNPTTDSLPNSK